MEVAPIHKVLTLLPQLTLLTLHNGTYAYIYCSMVIGYSALVWLYGCKRFGAKRGTE